MVEVILLKPRRNNSPFRFGDDVYEQHEDELGVVRLHVEDPAALAFMAGNPDTFEVPTNHDTEMTTDDTIEDTNPVTDEPAVVAPAEATDPVAVVSPEQEPAAEVKLKAKPAKAKSRLNG